MKDYIHREVHALKKRFDTHDPFRIAKGLGIIVWFRDIGDMKGCCRYFKRNQYIIINHNLLSELQWVICAHELGHCRLHPELMKGGGLQEFMMMDMTARPEREANDFASILLLDEDEIMSFIMDGYTTSQIAGEMQIYEEMIQFRLNNMEGYQLKMDMYTPRADFLRFK
jgi:Zn-dependent peptidase ImmA (M78 family)